MKGCKGFADTFKLCVVSPAWQIIKIDLCKVHLFVICFLHFMATEAYCRVLKAKAEHTVYHHPQPSYDLKALSPCVHIYMLHICMHVCTHKCKKLLLLGKLFGLSPCVHRCMRKIFFAPWSDPVCKISVLQAYAESANAEPVHTVLLLVRNNENHHRLAPIHE